MPLRARVAAGGLTGYELRKARGEYELLATGPCGRLGVLVPDHAQVHTTDANGAVIITSTIIFLPLLDIA